MMTTDIRKKLVAHINRKGWWHVPPADPQAYRKRGKFYSSSFREAEFWGRPLDQPHQVKISNPLIGDEDEIERTLFGNRIREPEPTSPKVLEWRWGFDARMKKAALASGYDAIVLLTPKAFIAYKESAKIPRSIELNVLKT